MSELEHMSPANAYEQGARWVIRVMRGAPLRDAGPVPYNLTDDDKAELRAMRERLARSTGDTE